MVSETALAIQNSCHYRAVYVNGQRRHRGLRDRVRGRHRVHPVEVHAKGHRIHGPQTCDLGRDTTTAFGLGGITRMAGGRRDQGTRRHWQQHRSPPP